MTRRRLVLVGVILATLFALEGGEFSTWNWLTLVREERTLHQRVAQLEQEIDSLLKEAVAVETDPLVQERIARERFGMLRRGEFSYQLVPDDDSEGRP